MGRNDVEGRASVVLFTYNGERYLSEALESIIEQTYDNLEVIVVIDGSTDNTEEISRDMLNESGRLHNIFKTTGPGHGLPLGTTWPILVGTGNSTGQFIHWHGDDDVSDPDLIRSLVEGIGDHSTAYCDLASIDVDSEPISIPTQHSPGFYYNSINDMLIGRRPEIDHIPTSLMLLRKCLWLRDVVYYMGANDTFVHSGIRTDAYREQLITLFMWGYGDFVHVPGAAYWHRRNPDHRGGYTREEWWQKYTADDYNVDDVEGPEGILNYHNITLRDALNIANERRSSGRRYY